MKKILTALSLVVVAASMAHAASLVKASANSYVGYLANESGLAYSNNYVLDVSLYDGAKISAEVAYSSVTFASKTFTDGTQSTGSLTVVSTSSLSGVYVTIAGVKLIAGTDFLVGATVGDTASNLARVINASTCALSSMISAQAIGSVVTTTSTLVGGNYAMTTSNVAKISLSGANMTGGSGAYYSAATDTIQLASHGFTLGLPVLYTQGAAIGGLTTGTTYYALPVTADSIRLSSSSALALAGTYVDITVQRAQTSANTYTLAPLAITGAPSYKWQQSNDAVTWSDVNIASVTASSYPGSDGFDFDNFNFKYLRMAVTGPSRGGISLQSIVDVKR